MIATESLTGYDEVREIVEKYGAERKNLLPILQAVQEKDGFISSEKQQIIADLLSIHPVEVFSVVSFYHFLNDKPKGAVKLRLCKSIACDMAGREKIKRVIEETLGLKAGEITSDGKIYFEEINCFGLCDVGPALTINDKIFTKLTEEDTKEILKDLSEKLQ